MNKEKFKILINEYFEQVMKVDTISDLLNISFDSDIINFGYKMFDEVINAYFTKDGKYWIDWYLYDKGGNPELKAFDKNNNEIPTETIDDIWELVKDYIK